MAEPGQAPDPDLFPVRDITVVTVTAGRRGTLRRAAVSVQAQSFPGRIEHLVIGDACPSVAADFLDGLPSRPGRSLAVHVAARPAEAGEAAPSDRGSVYPRLARLLNLGIRRAGAAWIAFLDDDNAFEPDHLKRLAWFAQRRTCPAVHAARYVLHADGTRYLDPVFPGAPDRQEGRRIHDLMCRRGVWEPGTNILRDRVDPGADGLRTSTGMREDDPAFLVDQNLWLVARSLLLRHPVPEAFTPEEIAGNTCPDDKMLAALVAAGVRIETNGHPSVRYYLGGISNGDGTAADAASPPVRS